jgi:uncharacterized protein YecT (DUF1311 family)
MRCLTVVLAFCAVSLAQYCALAQTQIELNDEANTDFAKADKALNETYKATMAALNDSQKTLLKEAQKLWIVYRDKGADAQASIFEGGSMQPMVAMGSKARMTEERTARLKAMVPAEVSARAEKLPDAAAAKAKHEKDDATINKVYKAYMAGAGEAEAQIMKEAQRAWIAYRDQCVKSEQSLFPADKAAAAGETCAAELTEARIGWLKEMFMEGYSEDDAPAAPAKK